MLCTIAVDPKYGAKKIPTKFFLDFASDFEDILRDGVVTTKILMSTC